MALKAEFLFVHDLLQCPLLLRLDQTICIHELESEVLRERGTHSALAATRHADQGDSKFSCH